ncbi:MFS transporter [Rhodovarius crocodyli]|uniref:MFS transporter n=1 Tax=Rhodovarius crocodyli TaxID=1979269 RepID=A0A437LX64_9PROT|nr:MFS transporter [Rhodovarius crocodyli]RVT89970.1 MFS transporter [Rhodovarius crocodyli]
MPAPSAFAPLRHPAFRLLWVASLASNIGLWIQNTAAGWLMTSLAPSPAMVSMVQAASMLPVFLLALPSGALADIMERRSYLLLTQAWLFVSATLLVVVELSGGLGAWSLLAFTFLLGCGMAMSFPGWAATTPELVPREDLVGAIALNGINFNIARALGPAAGGLIVASFGVGVAFAINAVCIAALAVALVFWKREAPRASLPPESFLSAIAVGLRFVRNTPAVKAAILRAMVFFLFGAAVWGLMPLLVRQELQLGAEAFGLMLGCMGAGAVFSGFIMPRFRARYGRGAIVLRASLISSGAMAVMGLAAPLGIGWPAVAVGIFLYGMCWLAGASTLQAAASLAAPGWVRARALGIYQMSFFGAMAAGSVFAGWLGSQIGVPGALCLFAGLGAASALLVKRFGLDADTTDSKPAEQLRHIRPEPAAAELRELLHGESGRVLESVRYTIEPEGRAAFLLHMEQVRGVRMRAGAKLWRLYENVAHPERFVEMWVTASWTEHLREERRMTETDKAIVAKAAQFATGAEASRYINLM